MIIFGTSPSIEVFGGYWIILIYLHGSWDILFLKRSLEKKTNILDCYKTEYTYGGCWSKDDCLIFSVSWQYFVSNPFVWFHRHISVITRMTVHLLLIGQTLDTISQMHRLFLVSCVSQLLCILIVKKDEVHQKRFTL